MQKQILVNHRVWCLLINRPHLTRFGEHEKRGQEPPGRAENKQHRSCAFVDVILPFTERASDLWPVAIAPAGFAKDEGS